MDVRVEDSDRSQEWRDGRLCGVWMHAMRHSAVLGFTIGSLHGLERPRILIHSTGHDVLVTGSQGEWLDAEYRHWHKHPQ